MNMKRILCALLACTIGVVSASALAGCGCSNNKGKNQESKSGYEVVATQPDLKDDTFGFYILNDTDLMITKYYGSLSDVVIPDTYKNYTVTTIGHSVRSRHRHRYPGLRVREQQEHDQHQAARQS